MLKAVALYSTTTEPTHKQLVQCARNIVQLLD